MTLAIILYLLGCYMHFHFTYIINPIEGLFSVDILLSAIWPITTMAYLLINVSMFMINNIKRTIK